jgi:hypothetical protein
MSAELIEKVVNQGGMFAVFMFGVYLFSRIGWWISRRLLAPATENDEGGLAVRWFNTHQEFLAGLEKRDTIQAETGKQHAALLNKLSERAVVGARHTAEAVQCVETLCEWAGDPDAPFATVHFNHSMVDLAKARLLELSIRPDTSHEEAQKIVAQVEALLKAVEARHNGAIERMEERRDV